MATEAQIAKPDAQDQHKAILPDHLKIKVKTNKVRTPGWRMFDGLVHFGINYIGNIAASIWFADDQAKYNISKHIENGVLEGDRNKYKSRLPWLYKWVNEKGGPAIAKMWGVKYQKNAQSGDILTDKFGNKLVAQGSEGRAEGAGITTDVLFLSLGGHITTALTQLFENSTVKPKMVRWLDKMLDSFRGNKLTEEQKQERADIYDKLDNELSGKSFAQTWKARFIGIAGVIASLFGLRLLDKGITKLATGTASDNSVAGLNRVKQGFIWTSKFIKGGLRENSAENPQDLKYPWKPAYLEHDPEKKNAGVYYADHMARLAATEVAGTTITSITQYIALMFKEFFGKQFRDKPEETTTKAEKKPGGVPVSAQAKEKVESKVGATVTSPEKVQQEERAAYAEKVSQAKKPEKSDDFREAVTKTAPQEAALAGI